jgi:hypothetical protein
MVGWVSGAIFTALVAGFWLGSSWGFHTLLCVIYDITLSTKCECESRRRELHVGNPSAMQGRAG